MAERGWWKDRFLQWRFYLSTGENERVTMQISTFTLLSPLPRPAPPEVPVHRPKLHPFLLPGLPAVRFQQVLAVYSTGQQSLRES